MTVWSNYKAACGRHSVFSALQEHSGKIFKSDIF